MKYYANKDVILKFYRLLRLTSFRSISDERRKELDDIVEHYRYFFVSQTCGTFNLMTLVAERLITSYKNYGLQNDDEKAYFYIKIVDPNLMFLEVYEAANKKDEIKDLCLKNFHLHDKYIIYLERLLNNRFQDYDPDDLWSRESIKR